jgi:hypothetical protein
MAWTAPMTAVANTVFTAAQFNTHIRDNLAETAPAKATTAGRIFVTTGANSIAERPLETAAISTSQTTTSVTYTDLSTVGPSVTITTGPAAIVWASCFIQNNTSGASSHMSFAVSGATAIAASDVDALRFNAAANNDFMRAGFTAKVTLTPGSNTFTMQYRVSGNTGTFANRSITVMSL